MFMNIIHRPVHKWLIKQIGIKSDDKVLDIGCGGGGLIALVSKETNEIMDSIVDWIKFNCYCLKF